MENLERINEEINRRTGSLIAKFYICPHLDTDNCGCRKPKEGLFLAAQKDFNIDFSRSWMIGDSESDIIPAKKLGLSALFHGGPPSALADISFTGFNELIPVAEGLFNKWNDVR
jgi:D-glycero-D-manno-heptose 1,7-bisphosphate phosphatase